MTRLRIVLLCGGLWLGGCMMFVPPTPELRLVDVKAVRPGTVMLYGLAGPLAGPQIPGAPAIIGRITVTSNVDLHRIAETAELYLSVDLRICRSDAYIYPGDGIYFQDVDINPVATSAKYQERAAAHKKGDPFTYAIYFKPSSRIAEAKSPGHPDKQVPYDFTQKPADLCLKIGGGNELAEIGRGMSGGYFVSNTVLIPSAKIARAFQTINR